MSEERRPAAGEPGFFEGMYRQAGGDLGSVPWAQLEPFPALVEWLDGAERDPGRALVVACGFGDDAEELARRGWEVSAFDVAATAIERARERFPESPVDYRVADLFGLPAEWQGRFDVVVEVRTLQSLPVVRRTEAAAAIVATLAPGGQLLLHALAHDRHRPGDTIPWPLTPAELGTLEAVGLNRECWRRHERVGGGRLFEVDAVLRRPG